MPVQKKNSFKSKDQNSEFWDERNQKKIFLISLLIVFLIVLLIVLVVVGQHHKESKKNNFSVSKTQNTNVYTTRATTIPVTQSNNSYYVNLGEEEANGTTNGVVFTVVSSISKEPNYYYFYGGKFDSTYTGLAPDAINFTSQGLPAGYYYVKNGVFQKNFRGLVSRDYYMRIVEHGKEQSNYNGEIRIGRKMKGVRWKWDCSNGAVLQYETGRLDNWVDPEMDWELLD